MTPEAAILRELREAIERLGRLEVRLAVYLETGIAEKGPVEVEAEAASEASRKVSEARYERFRVEGTDELTAEGEQVLADSWMTDGP